ncbi:MAG: glycoside hydrolase family 2 protein, partial [Clostridia bacterium]|nr:glycoside hydrolase family 2 protein [Clostridia bacterium]
MRHIFDLSSNWEMRPVSEPEWIPATVPGSVYMDLLENGKMPDPFYRDQEKIAFDLMETDYVYRTSFTPDSALLGAIELRLVMEGIDTLANISVNDQFVLHTENMHRCYTIDIRPFVHEGENTLTILLRSPLRAARAAYERHHVPGSTDAVQGFAMIRKAHCMYGWDWGPRLPDAGIYRPIYLWAVSEPKLKSVLVRQHHWENHVTLSMTAEMDLPTGCDAHGLSVRYTLKDPDGETVCECTDGHIEVDQPRLWWPNGYGEHPLYTLTAELFNEAGLPIDTWEKKIGLRTMEISRVKDEDGESFAFTIN